MCKVDSDTLGQNGVLSLSARPDFVIKVAQNCILAKEWQLEQLLESFEDEDSPLVVFVPLVADVVHELDYVEVFGGEVGGIVVDGLMMHRVKGKDERCKLLRILVRFILSQIVNKRFP